jgi:hypothetical protein
MHGNMNVKFIYNSSYFYSVGRDEWFVTVNFVEEDAFINNEIPSGVMLKGNVS